MFKNFPQFLKEYVQHLPSVALIGIPSESDQEFIWDLLSEELRKPLTTYRTFYEKSETLSIAQLSSLFEGRQLFPCRTVVNFLSVENLQAETKKAFDHYVKILSASQQADEPDPRYFALYFILWTRDRSTFAYYSKILSSKFVASFFDETAADRNMRKAAMLVQRAHQAGIKCTMSLASSFLKNFPQADCHTIINEFHKLLCFIGKKEQLEFADIQLFVEKKQIKSSIWKLRDAILRRQLMDGIQMLECLLKEQQEHPMRIIEFLRSQCLFGLKVFASQSFDEKTSIFRAYGKNALMQSLNDLFYTEMLLKQNKQEPIVAMQMLVVRMIRGSLSSSEHLRSSRPFFAA